MILPFLRKVLEGSEFECIKFEFFQKEQLLPIASKFTLFSFRAHSLESKDLSKCFNALVRPLSDKTRRGLDDCKGIHVIWSPVSSPLCVHSCSTNEGVRWNCGGESTLWQNDLKSREGTASDDGRSTTKQIECCLALSESFWRRHASSQNLVGAWGHIKFLFYHNINLKEDAVFTRKKLRGAYLISRTRSAAFTLTLYQTNSLFF